MSQPELQSASPLSLDSSLETAPKAGHNGAETEQMEADKPLTDKVRIYDLVREMARETQEVLEACRELGIPYKSHSSTISSQEAEQVRGALSQSAPRRRSAEPPKKVDTPRPAKKLEVIRKPKPAPSEPTSVDTDRGSHSNIVGLRKPAPSRPSAQSTSSLPEAPQGNGRPLPETTSLVRPPARPGEVAQSPAAPQKPQKPAAAAPEALAELAEKVADEKVVAETASPKAIPKKIEPKPELKPPMARPTASLRTPPRPPAESVAPKPSASRPTLESAAAESVRPSRAHAKPAQSTEPEEAIEAVPDPQPERKRRDAPKPQLAGPPTRPVLKKVEPEVVVSSQPEAPTLQQPENQETTSLRPKRPRPAPRPQLVGPPTRPEEKAPTPALRPVSRRGSPADGTSEEGAPLRVRSELVGPPVRPAAATLADPPARPRMVKRRSEIDEEEDQKLAGVKRGTRGTVKRKRSRRGGDETEVEVDNMATLSPAKQAEINALKPLPRPAPPPSNKPAATTPAPRQRTQQPRHRSHQPAAVAKEEAPAKPTSIQIAGNLTVQEVADLMQIPPTDIIRILFLKGSMVNINQVLDVSTIETVAKELECEVELIEAESEAKKTEMLDLADIDYLQLRSPVITIMGHVDHGKTTLLDSIRKTSVVSGEAGGITQRIGAYHVDVDHEGSPKRVVFLDTPGHEAFTAMRARGAKVTDIAILVVAADDGVQPQTLEALSHARAANVPIVVAINKIDKPGCQPDRIKQQLSEHGLVPEEWGGDTPMVEVSALSQINLDGLLEMLLLVAELGELQANPDRPAKGTVIEANMDRARGPVATVLVQNGTLRIGDAIVAGSTFGRVKAMVDDRGQRLEEAGPSSAVQLLGLSEVPAAGDEFDAYADEREARRVADQRQEEQRNARLQQMLSRRVSLGTVSAQAQEGQLKELNLIIKTDVQGSAEAILASLQQLSQEEVQLRVLLAGPGDISETDVDLAAASEAIIIGFATDASAGARQLADRYGVDIREYDIIYNLLEDITGAMEGLLEPEQVEEPLGQAEVRQVITIGRGNIAGCYVLSGKLLRNTPIRVLRRGEVIYTGRLDSLKRFKDDVREVASGFECGISVEKFTGWTEGDIIDAHQLVMKRRTLASASVSRR